MAERNLKPSKITSMNENYKGENFYFAQESTILHQKFNSCCTSFPTDWLLKVHSLTKKKL